MDYPTDWSSGLQCQVIHGNAFEPIPDETSALRGFAFLRSGYLPPANLNDKNRKSPAELGRDKQVFVAGYNSLRINAVRHLLLHFGMDVYPQI